jgi:UDP-N-acetylglucosamine/UDP-N-acetylgalactosamine diphosphorylase
MSTPTPVPSRDELQSRLDAVGQGQVLRYWDELDDAGRNQLGRQVAALDLDEIAKLAESHVKQKPEAHLPQDLQAPNVLPRLPDTGRAEQYQNAEAVGKKLLDEGKVAAFLVAGGQGTRLGYDGPKGEYPVTPVKDKPLFQVFAEQIQATQIRHGRPVPWYVMTSEVNDGPTRAFFDKHTFFGLDPANVTFFVQGMMPAFGTDGKLLLASKDSLALSADGHGGSLRALAKTGALADMKRRGIEHLSYFQVDNPLVRVLDPLFLGLHATFESEMSSKSLPKASAKEKVGNFCVGDGKLQVIEYSDLPDEVAEQTDAAGDLKFNAGSIAIHAIRVAFVDRLTSGGSLDLPWHRADKKVPHVDGPDPQSPNAVKLEQFVFDAIPLASNAIVYETDRGEEFSPVKNAEGNDSPATSRRDQVRRAAAWLKQAGVEVPVTETGEPDAVLEISPLFADSAEALREKNLPPTPMQPAARTYFGE